MTHTTSKVLTEAIASLQRPIEHFIETGIYSCALTFGGDGEEENLTANDISHMQVSRICRAVAKELRRPFIQMNPVIRRWNWEIASGGTYRAKPIPAQWLHAEVTIPCLKYLAPIAAPLLLAAGEDPTDPVYRREKATLWQFRINSYELWLDYRVSMDRPEMRKARRMKPLPLGVSNSLVKAG